MCLFYFLSAYPPTYTEDNDFINHSVACMAWPAFHNPNWNCCLQTHPMNSILKSQQVNIVPASIISFTQAGVVLERFYEVDLFSDT